MDLSAMSVGARIRFLREEKRMTQSELADKIGTTPQNIYKYEQGIISNIPINRVMQIAKVFDVSPSLIAGWEDEKEESPPPLVNDDEELTELLTRARDDPHIRMLFSVTKDATPEDVEKAIKIIQMLKGD